jgi:protein ImuB
LRRAAEEAGYRGICIGVADTAVVADVATQVVGESGIRIVKAGGGREFLSSLPLSMLMLPDELTETFHALGFQRVDDIAARDIGEFEARFGPDGVRAHRWAHGLDDQVFRAFDAVEAPETALELDPPAETLEPLLFVLRHLVARACADLVSAGLCAARIELDLQGRSDAETAVAVPARPTRQERLLYELCRAALERAAGSEGRLTTPVEQVVLKISQTTPPDARQEDLFTRRWRDPMSAAAALSRLNVRLGPGGVVRPSVRPDHRPESRSVWEAAEIGYGSRVANAEFESTPIPSVLHLLPEPVPLRVRMEEGRPAEIWGDTGHVGHHELVAAEGPERLSGDWWKDPYHREYFCVCTQDGSLLWLFREYRSAGAFRWWLHGWRD